MVLETIGIGILKMRELHKAKRVSWAPDSDIRQVRLFLSEDCPSQVGLSSLDDLQVKSSLLLHPYGAGSDGILPPGFEETLSLSQLQVKLSQIPVIKWTNPPKILLNLSWLVMAGEESKEVEDQNKREMRELEAIYPRTSSIPQNPSVSMDEEDSHCTDIQTALIPITPMEDEDAEADVSSDSMAPFDFSLCPQPHSTPLGGVPNSNSPASEQFAHGVESDVTAASVPLTNTFNSSEHGNLIDHELLNEILNRPELIGKLIRDYKTVSNLQVVPNARSSPAAVSLPSIVSNQAESSMPSAAFSASPSHLLPTQCQVMPEPSQPHPSQAASSVTDSSLVGAPPAKDFNYYKTLIQQHGGERQETPSYSSNCYIQRPEGNQETVHSSRSREQKPRIMKPCIYFNSSRGCRNGASCAYLHDGAFLPRSSTVLPGSKRMKLDGEISS